MGAPRGVELEDNCSAAVAAVKPDGAALIPSTLTPAGLLTEVFDEPNLLARVVRGDEFGSVQTSAPRESAWVDARIGRRFTATDQSVAFATLIAQASYSALTPTLMIRQNAGARTVILRSLTMTLITPPGTAVTGFRVVLDSVDRFNAGGAAVTPKNHNSLSGAPSLVTAFLENPTVTAEGGTVRKLANAGCPACAGAIVQVNFKDGIILGPTGCVLVYVFDTAGVTSPIIVYAFEWMEF